MHRARVYLQTGTDALFWWELDALAFYLVDVLELLVLDVLVVDSVVNKLTEVVAWEVVTWAQAVVLFLEGYGLAGDEIGLLWTAERVVERGEIRFTKFL